MTLHSPLLSPPLPLQFYPTPTPPSNLPFLPLSLLLRKKRWKRKGLRLNKSPRNRSGSHPFNEFWGRRIGKKVGRKKSGKFFESRFVGGSAVDAIKDGQGNVSTFRNGFVKLDSKGPFKDKFFFDIHLFLLIHHHKGILFHLQHQPPPRSILGGKLSPQLHFNFNHSTRNGCLITSF